MNKQKALSVLRPGEEWAWSGSDYSGLEWLDSTTKPTEAEIDAKLAEITAAEPLRLLRVERNRLLADSDWTQVADAPVDAAAWATYRQALRDLPATVTDPSTPT